MWVVGPVRRSVADGGVILDLHHDLNELLPQSLLVQPFLDDVGRVVPTLALLGEGAATIAVQVLPQRVPLLSPVRLRQLEDRLRVAGNSAGLLNERFADTDQTGIILWERVGGDTWNVDAFRIGVV